MEFNLVVPMVCFLTAVRGFGSTAADQSPYPPRGSGPPGNPTTPDSSQCCTTLSAQNLKRNYRLDSVKDDILRKLRMNSPPNVTGSVPNIPAVQTLVSQMVRESQNQTDLESDLPDNDHVSPATIILLSQRIPAEKMITIQNTCYFRFSPDLKDDQVLTAQLGIYIRDWNSVPRVSTRGGAATWILVFVIGRSPETNRLEKTLYRRRKIYLTPTDMGRWYFFDVKTLAENWTQHEDRNLGIQIYAQDLSGDLLAVLPTSNESMNTQRPYIEIQVEARGPALRPRRSMDHNCDENSSERRCCRYPLRIDFDAFRWDWVIAPKHYDAYYCSGDCPFHFYQRDPHTHVYTQATATGVPCCSPTLMSPLQILYVDSKNSVILGTLPGMIVERCGCS